WTLVEKHADLLRFVSLLVHRRQQRDQAHEQQRVSLTDMLHRARTAWHGVKRLQPDWSPQSHSLALGAEMPGEGMELYLVTNAFWEPLEFELPMDRQREAWRRWIDTSLDSPDDIVPWQAAAAVGDPRSYRVAARSVVVLWRRLESAGDRE